MRLLATAALLLAACSACAAQIIAPNTTGITLGGHKFASSVGGECARGAAPPAGARPPLPS